MKVTDDSTEKTDSDNGNKNGVNADIKRDASGRFVSGSKGGPGRKAAKPLSLEEIEGYLQKILQQDKDPKIQLAAAKVLLQLRKQTISSEPVLVNPELERLIESVGAKVFDDSEVQEVQEDDFFD